MGLFSKKHSIGKTIAELRKEKGWTQIELAEKLQVSDKAVSKWEKDSGAPSIEFFPMLAEVFGVSIDYLMTGKKVEPEVVAISKIELCAKNDDELLFETLTEEVLKNNDESGKTILDYFLTYNSKKTVQAFFKKYPAKSIQQSNGYRAGTSLWYADKILNLLIINNMLDELKSINAFIRVNNRQRDEWDIYTDKYKKLIFTNPNVSKELKECYIQSLSADEINNLLCLALDDKKEKDVYLLWNIISTINKANIQSKERKEQEVARSSMTSVVYSSKPCKEYEAVGTGCYYRYYVISLNLTCLQKLLDNGYVDIVKQANEFNKKIKAPIINDESIQVAVLKQNGGNEYEIEKLSIMKNGIVELDKLLLSKNFKFAKKVLSENPIHVIEKIISLYQKEDWKALFDFALDNKDNSFADCIIKGNKEEIQRQALSYWGGSKNDILNVNREQLYVIENGRKTPLISRSYGMASGNKTKNFEEVLSKIQAVKERVLSELSLKLDKEKTTGDLTKEYFDVEMKKNNYEIVIIKLCVKLEAILRCDYQYTGDFSEMLDLYCNKQIDSYGETAKLLNKLRMQRNNIVHAEKNNESLSLEELQRCIDYICKLS